MDSMNGVLTNKFNNLICTYELWDLDGTQLFIGGANGRVYLFDRIEENDDGHLWRYLACEITEEERGRLIKDHWESYREILIKTPMYAVDIRVFYLKETTRNQNQAMDVEDARELNAEASDELVEEYYI